MDLPKEFRDETREIFRDAINEEMQAIRKTVKPLFKSGRKGGLTDINPPLDRL